MPVLTTQRIAEHEVGTTQTMGKGPRTSLGVEKILRERSIFEDIHLE